MKTLMTAVALILLSSCAIQYDQNGKPICPANERQIEIINRWWPQAYNQCQMDIKKNLEYYKGLNVYSEESREAFCACVANGYVDEIKYNGCQDFQQVYDNKMRECLP
jgi:hypothetical protein